jgi:type I restriction enzyme, S subunit
MNDAIMLPDGWTLVPLGSLLKFQNGFNTEKSAYGRGLPFANVLEVITHSHLTAMMIQGRVATTPAETSRYLVRRGDILFNRTSETQEEVGLASVYLGDEPILFGGFVLRGKPISVSLVPEFAGYGLRSGHVRQQIVATGQGGIRANIGQQSLSVIKLALPPLPEQHAIAAALSDADGVVAGLERVIGKKRLIKQGAMQDLLTARRRLPGFSGEWVERKLGAVTMLQRGFDLPNSIRQDGGFPVVYSNGVMATHTSFMCEGPGVVTGRSGTIGNVTYVEGRYWPHNTALWVKNFFGNRARFIFYLLEFVDLRRFASGSGVPTLNRNDAHDDMVCVPKDVDEQKAICAVLDDMDAEIQTLSTRLTKARAVKEGMMQNLLTGRVRLV